MRWSLGSSWRLASVVAASMLLLAGVGCSRQASQPEGTREVAEKTIAGPLAQELGIGELKPLCPDIAEPSINLEFLCTAQASEDRVVNVSSLITASGNVQVQTTNVIRSDALPSFEGKAVSDLNGAAGSALLERDLNCGDKTVVLNQNREMVCAVKNNGETYDVTFTVSDIEAPRFDLKVASVPRE